MTRAVAVLALAAAGLAGCGPAGGGPGPAAGVSAAQLRSGVAAGYLFLSQMMDRYATGTVPRLVQSFAGGPLGRQGFTSSVTYDDALVIDAYLAAGSPAGRSRAEVVANGLLYAQAHDPQHDGRLRAAYAPTPLRGPADVTATDPASLAGNMAWAGQTLVRVYAATGRAAYLTAAEAIGTWIQAHCRDTRGPGGYTGGETAAGQRIEWKSTEHNIDLYALFSMLAAQTRDPAWAARAAFARAFVARMWDPRQGRFYVGTTADGATPNDASSPRTSTAGPTWPSVIPATRPRWAGTSATSPSPRAGAPARARAGPAARGSGTRAPRTWPTRSRSAGSPATPPGRRGTCPPSTTPRPAVPAPTAADHRRLPQRAPRLRRRHPVGLLAHGDDGLVHPGRQEGRPFCRRRPARAAETAGRAAAAGGWLSGGRCRCAGGAPAWPGSRPPRPGRSSTSAGAAGPCPGPRCGRAGSGCCRG